MINILFFNYPVKNLGLHKDIFGIYWDVKEIQEGVVTAREVFDINYYFDTDGKYTSNIYDFMSMFEDYELEIVQGAY